MTFWRRVFGDRAEDDGGSAPAPADRGPTIGEQLRERRTTLGLSYSDVERDIRINRRYLEALEDEQFELLPAPVYARGFMRSYARYLGLDAELAVDEVPRDLPRPSGLEPFPGLRRGTPVALPAFTPSVRLVLAGAAVVVLAALVWVALQLAGGSEPGISIATSTPVATATAAAGGNAPAAATPTPAGSSLPDFRGLDREAAVALAELLQLVPQVVEQSDAAPAGQVIDQSPLPGAVVQQNDGVTLFVSTGPAN